MSRSWAFNSLWFLWGALAALGRPGIELWPCYFAGFVAFFIGVLRAPSHAVALVRTLCFGFALSAVFAIGGLSWGAPVPLGIALTVNFAVVAPLGLLARVASRFVDPIRATLFVGFAWSLTSFSLSSLGVPCYTTATAALPLSQTLLAGARLTGMSVVDGILVAATFAVSHELARRSLRARATWLLAARATLVPLALLLLSTLLARAGAPRKSGALNVGVAQVNVDSSFYESRLHAPDLVAAFDARLDGLLKGLERVDLVALPEAFDGRYGLLLPSMVERWSERAKRHRQGVVVTSYLPEATGQKSNAAGLFDRNGRLVGVHRKVVLAPYGERGLAAGELYRAFELDPSVRVGIVICQESMEDRAVRELVADGASVLVATTSDLSFGSSVLAFEHLAATRLRAIEAGRSVVWASNGGPSGVIDRFGDVARFGPFRQAVAVSFDVELFEGRTPYARLRWVWLGFQCLGLAACLAYAGFARADATMALASSEPSQRRGKGIVATALSFVLGFSASIAFAAVSPALVEWRSGEHERAVLAVNDLFAEKPRYSEADPLASFRGIDQERAALAYFLGYYGDARRASDLPRARAAGLPGVALALDEHFGLETRAYDLAPRLPRVAALVELKDGTLGVVASPGDSAAWLFHAKSGRLLQGEPAEIRKLLGTRSLLPALTQR